MKAAITGRFSRRLLTFLVAALLVIFLVTAARLRNGSFGEIFHKEAPKIEEPAPPLRPPMSRLPIAQCSSDINYLRQRNLDLSNNIVYSRRCVKPLYTDKFDRDDVTNIAKPLVTHKTSINLTDCTAEEESIPCDNLPLSIPFPYPAENYSHLIFGIASTYDRVNDSLPAFAHWLKDTGSLLVVVIVDAEVEKDGIWTPNPNINLTVLQQQYEAAGVTCSFIAPTLKINPRTNEPEKRTEHHHFMLIRDCLSRATPDTKWIGILDDDTFFPSLHPLDQELQRYNPNKPFWLGTLSDSWGSVRNWGIMAYGGAGAFVSLPLAREMEPHLESCIRDAGHDTGDGILRDCVYTRTHTRLTIVDGLYQHDMSGDMSGFYESGIRPLSLHHWKSWYRENLPKQAAITNLCGSCYLGRWTFSDDALFVNGYSISTYPLGLGPIDLNKMEATWHQAESPGFEFSMGPMRPRLSRDWKKSYHLKDAGLVPETGAFRQLYVYRGDEAKEEDDEVIELLWEQK